MLFIPGANSAKRSLPKYDWPAPAATTRESYVVIVIRPPMLEVTVLALVSIASTVPRMTRTFFCFARISRVGGAISP